MMHPTKDDIGKKVKVRSDCTDCGDYVGEVGTLIAVSKSDIQPPADVEFPQFKHTGALPKDELSEFGWFYLCELDLV